MKYQTDGTIVTDGNGFMGIFSTVTLLNEYVEENKKLKHRLDSNDLGKIIFQGYVTDAHGPVNVLGFLDQLRSVYVSSKSELTVMLKETE